MSLNYLQQHLGVWQGWFRSYDAHGQLLGQKASEISFRELAPQVYEQVNRYGSQCQRWVYHSLAAGLKFFPDGSFSNGQIQLAPFSGFAVEQGFLWLHHKARLVQQWDPQGQTTGFTTILEGRGQPAPQELPPWDGSGLSGTWIGTSLTYPADGWQPESGSLRVTDLQSWWQTLTPAGVVRCFPGQLVAIYPARLPMPTLTRERHFRLQLGWLATPEHYLHLCRSYNSQGTWSQVSLWHFQREKIPAPAGIPV
ncbi:MAG: DUF3598 family protein [Thermostichales cyanobacterium SZTDM-1c_bins_54]